jgi:ribokinase
MRVVVLGSANVDQLYRVTRIPDPGETILAKSAENHPGGKGTNQAIAVARAGAEVSFIAAIGRDTSGDLLVDTLNSAGVRNLVRRVDEPTGSALILVDDSGENTIVVNPGSNARLVDLTRIEHAAIASADYLLTQLEIPVETVAEAAQVAAAASTKVVLNASPIRLLSDALLRNVDVLLLNEHEALTLIDYLEPGAVVANTVTVAVAIDMATFLIKSVPNVVITLGGEGAVVCSRGDKDADVAHVPAASVTAIDTTGAGDAFAGALVAELSRGETLVDAAAFASAAGAIAVQRYGAAPSIPTFEEINAFRPHSASETPQTPQITQHHIARPE